MRLLCCGSSLGGVMVRIFFLSSGRFWFFLLQSVLDGGSCESHSGPCHQSVAATSSLGLTPLEARSAGLVEVGTYLQCEAGTLERVSPTLLLTYVESLSGGMLSQHKTMVLHRCLASGC